MNAQAILADLARVKVMFQLRTIEMVIAGSAVPIRAREPNEALLRELLGGVAVSAERLAEIERNYE